MDELKLELNLALIPEPSLAERLIKLSQSFARRYETLVQLGDADKRLTLAPHLTLYQTPMLVRDLAALNERLAEIAHDEKTQTLKSSGLAYNEGEASLEDRKRVTDELLSFQEQVISAVNPLRGELLLERDPAGNKVADLLQAPGRLGENIRETGYAEVGDPKTGGLFRPHDTLNWFRIGTKIDVAAEQQRLAATDLSGSYVAIGIFILGPHGTCPQLLSRHNLSE